VARPDGQGGSGHDGTDRQDHDPVRLLARLAETEETETEETEAEETEAEETEAEETEATEGTVLRRETEERRI
jgi:hypothetical protein